MRVTEVLNVLGEVSEKEDVVLADLTSDFDFTQAPRPPMTLPVHPDTTLTGTPTQRLPSDVERAAARQSGSHLVGLWLAIALGIVAFVPVVWVESRRRRRLAVSRA